MVLVKKMSLGSRSCGRRIITKIHSSPMLNSVWMYNFSGSEEEFALASCLIRQGTVVETMMIIKSSSMSYPASKMLKIEAAVAKLQALQWMLSVHCV